MRRTIIQISLDETYRRRAIAPGTARFWAWVFAPPEIRAPLLGILALLAEWQALMDPATEPGVARIKLGWWQEELDRLRMGAPVHPIGRYLGQFAASRDSAFAALNGTLAAAAEQVAGVPIERGVDLARHANSLWGEPQLVALRLGSEHAEAIEASLSECASALAAGEYLARAIAGYRRDAAVGRVPFAVDQLQSAGIETADLSALEPPRRLQDYLAQLREQAVGHYARALQTPRGRERARGRHLLVLAAIGLRQIAAGRVPTAQPRLRDAFAAWRIARRAAAGK
jgi:15-cis-phytoene synthase